MRALAFLVCLGFSLSAFADGGGTLFPDPLTQSPFLKGRAWKPELKLLRPDGKEAELPQLRQQLETLLTTKLEQHGISVDPKPTTFESTSGSSSTKYDHRPRLRVVLFYSDGASSCHATAHDLIPGTRSTVVQGAPAVGVVWASGFGWSTHDKENDTKEPRIKLLRMRSCIDYVTESFSKAIDDAEKQSAPATGKIGK